MSIVHHAVWSEIRPYWDVQSYERDATAKSGPRYRLELRKLPRDLSLRLRQLQQPCVACGTEVHVFRQRKGGDARSLYFAPSCPEAMSPGCKRGLEASTEYARVRAALEGSPLPPTQDGLFEVRRELGLDLPKEAPPPSDPGCQASRTEGGGCPKVAQRHTDATPDVAEVAQRRAGDCVVCRRPALCKCQAPSRRENESCGRPMCESCASKVRHASTDWLLCPNHAAQHHQGTGPLWVRPLWMRRKS